MERLTNHQILDTGLLEWRKLAQALHARYLVRDYAAAAAFVTAVAQVAEADGHHPDVRLTRGAIDISLCTREDGLWVTQEDIEMTRKISDIAEESGVEPRPADVRAGGERRRRIRRWPRPRRSLLQPPRKPATDRSDNAEAPAFTVLADPDGNGVCICTAIGR